MYAPVDRTSRERAHRAARALSRELGSAAGLGLPALRRHPVWAESGEGGGLGVVVVPGFGGADGSMVVMRRWLTRRGYVPTGGRLGFNVGCTAELVDRLERRVEELAEATGRPVVLIGHSRGGWLTRIVAVRRPELVRGLVMLGSPVLDPLDAGPMVALSLRALVRLSTCGVRGLLDDDCLHGPCGQDTVTGLAAPLLPPALAIYSRADAVVGWRSCLDPAAEWAEVRCSHTGMGTDPALYALLVTRLADWAASPGPRDGGPDVARAPVVRHGRSGVD